MNKPKLDASPVAWMYEDASGTMKMLGNTQLEEWVTKFNCKEIPLYTAEQLHPIKELTDEEIEECWFAKGWQKSVYTKDLITLARFLLRKAQEK